MFMSMIFKSTDIDEDDADEDEENPELQDDQIWLYDGGIKIIIRRARLILYFSSFVQFSDKSKRLGFGGLDEEMLEELREKRKKEVEMWKIIIELVVYSIFIWTLLVISYGQR